MVSTPIALSASNASLVAASLNSSHSRSRVVLVASADSSLRERLRQTLTGLRWHVIEAPGGAEAWVASQEATQLEAVLIDSWLPDLDVSEFLADFHQDHPLVDLMTTDGAAVEDSVRSPYHQELLYALRRSQDGDTAAWQAAPNLDHSRYDAGAHSLPALARSSHSAAPATPVRLTPRPATPVPAGSTTQKVSPGASEVSRVESANAAQKSPAVSVAAVQRRDGSAIERIPELIGNSPAMLEVSRRIGTLSGSEYPADSTDGDQYGQHRYSWIPSHWNGF